MRMIVDPLAFLNNLAASGHGMTSGLGLRAITDEARNQWTMFFLTSYMMSGMDGGGYAVTYERQGADRPALRALQARQGRQAPMLDRITAGIPACVGSAVLT